MAPNSLANAVLILDNLRSRASMQYHAAAKHADPDAHGAQYWKGAMDALEELQKEWQTHEPSSWGI